MDERARKHRGIARRDVLLGIRHPGGIGEVRSGEAELLCETVHHLHERGLGAGDVLGERKRGVVAGLDDHSLQQVFDRDLLADLDVHRRAAELGRRLAPGVFADRDQVIELDAAFLERVEHDIGGHQLGQAGGLLPRIRVERREHAAAVVIDNDEAARLELRWRRQRDRRAGSFGSIGRGGRRSLPVFVGAGAAGHGGEERQQRRRGEEAIEVS